jgi:hypothetical protein
MEKQRNGVGMGWKKWKNEEMKRGIGTGGHQSKSGKNEEMKRCTGML